MYTHRVIFFVVVVGIFAFSPFFVYAATSTARVSIIATTTTSFVGETFPVDVIVASPVVTMNAVSGTLVFSPTLLEVVSISKEGSRFPLWMDEPVVSSANGTVHFAGLVMSPGFLGDRAQVLRIVFRARTAGEAVFEINDASVLANDGLGTNIETTVSGARVRIQSHPPAPPPHVEVVAPVVPSQLPMSIPISTPDRTLRPTPAPQVEPEKANPLFLLVVALMGSVIVRFLLRFL